MKKLFYLVLCFILVAGSAQAGAVNKSANQGGNAASDFLPPLPPFPPWASEIKKAVKPSIYFYDVKATDTHGPGLLIIDFAKHAFFFYGKGFKPSQKILLRASAGADRVFASGKTTPKGNLHIAGAWKSHRHPTDVVPVEVVPDKAAGSDGTWGILYGFYFENDGWFVAKVAAKYRNTAVDPWNESAHTDGITINHGQDVVLDELGVPDNSYVRIHVIVEAGADQTGDEIFWSAPDPNGYCYAYYWIEGATWNPELSYYGRACYISP
jgi:hypothetical protein